MRARIALRCPGLLAAAWLAAACQPAPRATESTPTCVSCHEQDRARASFPDHLAPSHPTACQQCHTQKEWKPAALDHSAMPLVGGHSNVDCASCHAQEPVPKACVGCHEKDRQRGPGHTKPGFSTNCQSCHTLEGWKPASVDHSKFPFEGGHANVACIQCHPDPKAPNKPIGTQCVDCHAKDRQAGKNPDHLAAGFSTQCESCHTVATWKSATFAHDKLPLVGKHKSLGCAKCHTDATNPKQAKGKTCADCHAGQRPQGATTVRPDHWAQSFPLTCQFCHTANGWKPAAADHSKFPLTGKHGGLDCAGCHTDPLQPKVPTATTCVGCHDADRKKPKLPDHLQANFSTDCTRCHATTGWKPASFDHGKRFPLTGGHAGVSCANCHAVEPVPTTCIGCHEKKIPKGGTAARPDHQATGFSTTCSDCHGTSAWRPASFDHAKFPLTQAHAAPACTKCHSDPNRPEVPIGTTCTACHLDDRPPVGSTPDHRASGFPTACQDCHTPTLWKNSTFDHSTKFALVGKHATAACSKCHTDPAKPTTTTGTACVDCNGAERPNGATASRPDHHAPSFPTQCQNCHTATGWKPAAFDHAKFPLTGRHTALDCVKCHTDPAQPNVPKGKTCVGCHDADRQKPKLPDHLAVGFSTDCKSCHATTGWQPASFDHGQTFPLTGGHSGVGCASCHAISPVPKTCIGCHQAKIPVGATASRPDHNTAGFSTDCSSCHTTAAWKPASFSHTKFPLTQAHAAPACAKCHTDPANPNVAKGTTCTQCHLADRPPAGHDPDHLISGFPTTCEDCHTPTVWTTATFDHSTHLPLIGKHATLVCGQCHNKSPLPTTCEGCHSPPATGHLGQPNNCDSCHSVNGWKPAAVDHSKFPLTGKHATALCADCHTDPSKPNVPKGTTCVGCHDADRSKPTIPNHLTGGFPTDCVSCHATSGWKPASFTHKFPITSGKHKNLSCNTCHLNAADLKDFSCLGTCHKHTASNMNNKHKGRNGYIPNDFKHCIDCHANGKVP